MTTITTTLTTQQNLHGTKKIYPSAGGRYDQQNAASTPQVLKSVAGKTETQTSSNPSKTSSGLGKKTSPKGASAVSKAKSIGENNAAGVSPKSSSSAQSLHCLPKNAENSISSAKLTPVAHQNNKVDRLKPQCNGKVAKTRHAAKPMDDDTLTANDLFYALVGMLTVLYTVGLVLHLNFGPLDNVETVANQVGGKISDSRNTNCAVSGGEKRRPLESNGECTMLQLFVNDQPDACSSATVPAPKNKSDGQQHKQKQPSRRFRAPLSRKAQTKIIGFAYVFMLCLSWFTCKCTEWYDKYPSSKNKQSKRDVKKNNLE